MDFNDLNQLPSLVCDYLTTDVAETITADDRAAVCLPLESKKGGKGFRNLLLFSLCDYLGIEIKPNHDNIMTIAAFIDRLHDSSLLIDDIEDNSKTRRNEPCAYLQYGVALTLNCGTFEIFNAINKLILTMESGGFCTETRYKVLMIVIEEIMDLHIGQGLEIFWRDISLKVPDLENYMKMIRMKTGGMLKVMGRILTVIFDIPPDSEKDLQALMGYIGIMYQIRDDYLNIVSEGGTDILEGKFSFPILMAINKQLKEHETSTVYELVTKKYKPKTDVEHVLGYLEESGCLAETKVLVNRLVDHVVAHFRLGDDTPLAYLLLKLRLGEEV